MALDMAAIKAKLLAAAAANKVSVSTPASIKENENETGSIDAVSNASTGSGCSTPVVTEGSVAVVDSPAPAPVILTSTDVIGTAKTSEIDHLDFLAKMNALQQAIHAQHPTMPVLLMQIHKQLRADPELTSTLSEEGIGVIVKGLQIQTKTELVSVVVKESKSKKKKEPISLDMF